MVVRHLLVPLLGWHAEIIGARIRWDFIDGQVPWAGVATFVVLICLMLLCAFRCRRLVVPWLMIPGLAIAWLSYYGALDKRLDLLLIDVGERYAFVPQVLFGLTLVAIATQGSEVARRVAAIAVAWIVMVGVAEYTLVGDHFINGPDWALEVALWRADPAHHLQIWPRGWEIVLPAYAN
jgi:hypothetical protein